MSAQHIPSFTGNALSALAATALALAGLAAGSPNAPAADNDPDEKAAETLIIDLLTGRIAKADTPASADNARKTAPGDIELQVIDILADAAEQRRQADNPQPPDPFALPDREEENDAGQWLVDLIKAVVLQEDNHELENAPEDLDLVNVILGANEARDPDSRQPRARKLGTGVRELLLFISLLVPEGTVPEGEIR